MGKCIRCGNDAGFLSDLCEQCDERSYKHKMNKILLEKQDKLHQQEETKAEKENNLSNILQGKVEQRLVNIKLRLAKGHKAFIYKKIYIPVDSVVFDEVFTENFDISMLQVLGYEGWEIVQVVQKTLGLALSNKYVGPGPSHFAGGVGGNVIGVYVILKKEFEENISDDDLRSTIYAALRQEYTLSAEANL